MWYVELPALNIVFVGCVKAIRSFAWTSLIVCFSCCYCCLFYLIHLIDDEQSFLTGFAAFVVVNHSHSRYLNWKWMLFRLLFSLIHFSFGIQKHSETIEFADTTKFFLENTHQIDGLWQAVAHIMKIIIFSFKTSRRHHQCVRTHVIRFTMSDVMKTHISLSSCLFSYDECLLWHSLMIISIGALVHGIRLFYS